MRGREKCVLRKIEMLRYFWHGVLNDVEDLNGLCRRYAFVVLAGATSDTNGFAGDPRGRVGREKDGHGGNILRFAQSAERGNGDIVPDVFLAEKPLRLSCLRCECSLARWH